MPYAAVSDAFSGEYTAGYLPSKISNTTPYIAFMWHILFFIAHYYALFMNQNNKDNDN